MRVEFEKRSLIQLLPPLFIFESFVALTHRSTPAGYQAAALSASRLTLLELCAFLFSPRYLLSWHGGFAGRILLRLLQAVLEDGLSEERLRVEG